MTSTLSLRRGLAALALAATLVNAHAAADAGPSDVSALSTLPIAVSVTVPALLISGVAELSVVGIEASGDASVWVLERVADGARASVRVGRRAAGGVSVAVGTGVLVTAVSAGWVLSVAGQAVAFVPNQVGAALLHNERVTR